MKKITLFLTAIVLLSSCNNDSITKNNKAETNKEISELFDHYNQEKLKLYPLSATSEGDARYNDLLPNNISEGYRAQLKDFYTYYKSKLAAFDRSQLSSGNRVSYDVLNWECNINIAELNFSTHLMPIDQYGYSIHIRIGRYATGSSAQPFNTVKDYEDWLKRLDAFVVWCDTAVLNMKRGMEDGYVLPTALTKRVIPQIEAWTNPDLDVNHFNKPVSKIPDTFSQSEKQNLTDAYRKMINQKLIPTFQNLLNFLQNEYLPNSRSTAGVGALPNGTAYYQHMIKRFTTTDMKPDEIFALGEKEVKRISDEMRSVMKKVGFEGDLNAFYEHLRNRKESMPFTNQEQVIAYYHAIHEEIKPQLLQLFDKVPIMPFEIRRVEAFREKTSTSGYRRGSNDGSRPGIFYVSMPNVEQVKADEPLFLHEAIPGHHYQTALQMENKKLPDFMRNYRSNAFGEGWALYCESLGEELGLYTDQYQYAAMLSSEMFRANRLVVDVGIHAKGWTREQAIQYMLDNGGAESEEDAVREIERYMAIPGQSLSYKIGQIKFQKLRAEAQEQLGKQFDIRVFHNIVLENGRVPLYVLENIVNEWIESKKEHK